ncbi:uncharacterized protein LOC6036441 isoform X1 [Culex quinquefasciatus]|uniref:uncharacterized protein LOC6036441 isoform X1 n=1 Tax=Culex quinquefasciatus TaxID=7176 RepID=UPI0018E2C6D7|nr:uncharacterized protein LOC6036441 isoform X1 [Culex quinquefasciatus]XP_038112734.1 uncharacterized protein LOC6036441 isoform X1 [Culex quinquefasciatus]XP_038112735.1 uncharacterized protein LOC6036441 isoform X1 [Culex quinquefasciatus]XP_038112736.1 uncharacterized protein LOC6036441 isoform X1 [Culex quinquefasciatus]XP_038112737.1 uncharacterized protein LOC6036441 isoform X1 [Culex quinquefasciatus]XP_038112739.1 uncharacterized protein LOC6036441 isoform X1 [Culex quinquefasciatus]
MNKSDGDKALSNERKNKKKLVPNKNVPDSRSSATGSGGFHSFFRWFRKDQRDPDLELPQVVDLRQPQPVQAEPSTPAAVACASNPQVASEISSDEVSQSNGTHSSSPSPSPVIDCNNLSKASSCDSILSTATTGFAFVPPNCYDEVIGRLPQTERVINPGPYTDSYKRRVRQLDQTREQDKKNDLTLRKKYNLFSSIRSAAPKPPERDATLTRHNQKPTYPDLSLPSTSKVTAEANKNDDPTDSTVKRHRRTVSDSSKDRKAGAYVHVRGKRRAPPPPPLDLNANSQGTLSNQSQSSYGTLSPGSTLSRKKRPAPLPPPRSPTSPTLNEAVSNTSLLEDKEIKAIIEGTSRPKSPTFIMPIRTTPLPGISEERTPGGLTEEQKQQLIDNIRRVQTPEADPRTPTNAPSPSFMLTNNDVMKLEENFINTNGTRSPIHDYLYAEAVNSNVKPGIPTSPISPRPWYKRPISGTKQQESSLPFKKDIILKTIDKRKAKQRDKEDLPEVGYCRNSLVDTGSTSHSATKFNLFAKITEKSDDTKRRERDNEKRKSGIGIPSISELDREAAEIINKENALKQNHQAAESDLYFSAPEQLVKRSRSFVSKDEPESIDQASGKPKSTKELISRFEATSTNISKVTVNPSFIPKKDYFGEPRNTQPTPPDSKENTPPQGIVKTGSDKNLLGLWSCPYCTLENPNWRIICEACERIKPYEKLSILEEPPLRPNHPLKKAIPEVKAPPQQPTAEEWDKKTERVLKYFMPKTNPTMGSGGTPESPKKSFGQAKMLASPKMGVKSLMNRMSPDKPNGFRNFNANPEVYHATNKFDDEKLKENAVVVTTVPTVIAPLASPEPTVEGVPTSQIDLDEVRNARIARFSTNLDKNDDEPPKHVQDMDDEALEKEKERLREMIRAMNAKALADKYPVLQKPPSSGPAKRESPLMQRRNGFISGIPVSTNSPKPIRKASPTMAKRAAPIVEEHPPVVAEPYKLGAIKKTFVRKTEEPKIINQEVRSPAREQNLSPQTIPKTVTELNEPKLVLTNDVQRIRYEVMDEEQFKQQNPAPRHDTLTRQAPFSDQQNEKVRQISHQLRSAQGVQHFKNTLKYAGTSMTRTNTLAINKLLRNLELAIGEGAHDKAARLAMDLAKMKVSLSVTRQSPGGSDSGSSGSLTETSVTVYINDKNSRKGPLKVSVSSTLTLAQWKLKFARDYGIPLAIQRWVCNDLYLSNERKTLYDYGVDSEHVLQLYIVSEAVKPLKPLGTVAATSVVKVEEKVVPVMTVVKPQFSKTEAKILSVSDSDGDGSDTQNEMHEDDSKLGATALPTISENNGPQNDTEEGWVCPLCTLINPPNRPGCGACSEARPATYVVPARYRRNDDELIPEELKRFIQDDVRKSSDVQLRNPPKELRNDLNRVSSNRKSSDIFNILLDESKVAESQTRTSQPNPSTTDLLTTRHIQVPEQKNIVMTAFASPNITRNKYRGVDNFNPNSYNNGVAPAPKEGPIISTASPIVRAVLLKERKPVKFERNGLVMPDDDTDVTNHYMELVNLDSADVIANVDAFECPICFSAFEQYEGVVLRDCLHTFCKECLANTINFSEEAEIRCPFMDAVYSCESVITQREIKALVTKDMYEAYLARSIRQAESKLDNTFHCKTPNCRGWCIYEDNVNEFKCPVCTIVNCLTCRAIHDGLDCKQFQDRIKNDCDTNIEARQTRDMLQEMVDRGDALMCPTCQVVMMKKWGCDWLKCSMCKTEICWVTRGPRWGPGGKGDTSAGCRCGVDGKKCHPSCNYCH